MEWHSSQPLTLARCFSGSLITVHIPLQLRWCRNALGRAQLHVFMASPCTVKGKGSRCYCTAAHTDGLFIYTVVVWCVIWTPTCLFGVLGLVKCHPGAPAPRPTSSDSRARAHPRESGKVCSDYTDMFHADSVDVFVSFSLRLGVSVCIG